MKSVPTVYKPIMISCAGRSGSTFYYRLLARHQDLGWLSTYNQAAPSQTWLAVFSRLYGVALFDRIKHKPYFPKPFSPYEFWSRFLPDIARHDRPLVAADVPDDTIEPIRHEVAKILRYQSKPRFLMKVTGWARMAYFDRIFPDMRFIYLRRNPIAVVTSWVNAGWLNVTGELGTKAWEWGTVPEEYHRIYRDLGGGPLLAAAVKTQLDIDDLRRNAALFPDRCYELDYEVLVEEPKRCLRETLDFCELDWTNGFEAVLESTRIDNHSQKWKKQLSDDQTAQLVAFFERTGAHDHLAV